MATENDMSFKDMFEAVKQLPGSWGPRREQPSWDRDFEGRQEIHASFVQGTDKAKEWMAFALGFSDTLIGGYEGLPNVRQAGVAAITEYVPKGKNQFED